VTGYEVALAPCFTCKRTFAFDPERVVSVPIDPETGLPPDAQGARLDMGQYVKQPICPACCMVINEDRARLGLMLLDTTDTATDR
jgi:hypothetical protein